MYSPHDMTMTSCHEETLHAQTEYGAGNVNGYFQPVNTNLVFSGAPFVILIGKPTEETA